MDALFIEANSTIEQVSSLFAQLDRGGTNEIELEENIKSKLESLEGTFDRLEVYILKEPPGRRQTSRLRLNQLKYDREHLNASLQQAQRRRERRYRDASEREELLNRRFTTNADSTINIDHSLQHQRSLQNSSSALDDMLSQGSHILTNLRDQHGILKRTKKRMLDFTNYLGLSNTTMGMIERRAREDKFILFIGMGLTMIIIFFIYFMFV